MHGISKPPAPPPSDDTGVARKKLVAGWKAMLARLAHHRRRAPGDADQPQHAVGAPPASRAGAAPDAAVADEATSTATSDAQPMRERWQQLAATAATTLHGDGGGFVLHVLLLGATAIGLVSTLILFGLPPTGLAHFVLPVVNSTIAYTVVKLHAVLALGLAPLLVFTGIRRDPYFPPVGLFVAALCGLTLLVLLASQGLVLATPGSWVYLGLLMLQTLFAPYLLLLRRLSSTAQHRPPADDIANVPAMSASATKPTLPQPDAKSAPAGTSNAKVGANDLMIYVKQCPRCRELIRRVATECRHCGFRYSPELFEKEQQMFAHHRTPRQKPPQD